MTTKGISKLEKDIQCKNRRTDQAHVAMVVILK